MAGSKTCLLNEPNLFGWDYAYAHTAITDKLFRDLFESANASSEDFAVIAVGGYGRKELCPHSDFDVLLVHRDGVDASSVAEALWYPIWDKGLTLGYSVVTLNQLLPLVSEDINWATSILNARYIIGSESLFDGVVQFANQYWSNNQKELMQNLSKVVLDRQAKHGDSAFLIEPDLKNGRGGLRDIHTMLWASKCLPGFAEDYLEQLKPDVDIVLSARVELHRAAGRPGDILTFDAQDEIFGPLGEKSAAAFMLKLATAARRIGWYSDDAWARWKAKYIDGPLEDLGVKLTGDDKEYLEVVEHRVRIKDNVDVSEPPCLVLRLARVAAESNLLMSRSSLAKLAESSIDLTDPWNDEAKSDFVGLLLAGRPAIRVIEDLDHYGLMEFVLPEWSAVRCHPQRNALHRFTVDRHLCETAIKAGELSDRVDRPDLLVVGALLHDIGKGFKGDHTEVGVELIANIGERMGFEDDDISVLADLCRHHLLLADVCTRRNLSDPATATIVAGAVQNIPFLHLLAALTEADSISTGPSAWGTWKEGLLQELVQKTEFVLEGGEFDEGSVDGFPTPEIQKLMDIQDTYLKGKKEVLTVVKKDVSNLFGLMSGVLAVSGLQVVKAAASSQKIKDGSGRFVKSCQFSVQIPSWGEIDWPEVEQLAAEALEGKIAIQARIANKVLEQKKYRKRLSAEPPRHEVRIDNVSSDLATIIEVHSLATIGLLYRATSALYELRLEIRFANVQTFGPQMVNTFYITDRKGRKVFDSGILDELKLAVKHVLTINTR